MARMKDRSAASRLSWCSGRPGQAQEVPVTGVLFEVGDGLFQVGLGPVVVPVEIELPALGIVYSARLSIRRRVVTSGCGKIGCSSTIFSRSAMSLPG